MRISASHHDAKGSAAFTLVELLLVVSVIILLIALLMPALARSREQTRRTICASNLGQIVNAQMIYGADRSGRFVPSQVTTGQPGLGVYAVWGRSGSWQDINGIGRFRAHGILGDKNLIDPQMFYCPSWTHRMNYDVSYPPGGGWPANGVVPGGQSWIQTHYPYRSTFLDLNNDWRPANSSLDPGSMAVHSDAFSDPSRGIDVHHLQGYNASYIDGSAQWLSDPNNFVRDYRGGVTYHAGAQNYGFQEDVWQAFFDK